jgi:hypothetical protein
MQGLPKYLSADIQCSYPFYLVEDVRTFAVAGNRLFAGTARGVLLFDRATSIWIPVNAGLPDSSIGKLFVAGNDLFACTNSAGFWRRPLREMITSVEGAAKELPVRCQLRQNYPNPFNPSTMITFSLPRRVHVKLEVFNALGQKVCELVNGEFEGGYHGVRFDGSNFASGAYLCRLQAGTSTDSKSMLLVK